jgi:hypothetical protein
VGEEDETSKAAPRGFETQPPLFIGFFMNQDHVSLV